MAPKMSENSDRNDFRGTNWLNEPSQNFANSGHSVPKLKGCVWRPALTFRRQMPQNKRTSANSISLSFRIISILVWRIFLTSCSGSSSGSSANPKNNKLYFWNNEIIWTIYSWQKTSFLGSSNPLYPPENSYFVSQNFWVRSLLTNHEGLDKY